MVQRSLTVMSDDEIDSAYQEMLLEETKMKDPNEWSDAEIDAVYADEFPNSKNSPDVPVIAEDSSYATLEAPDAMDPAYDSPAAVGADLITSAAVNTVRTGAQVAGNALGWLGHFSIYGHKGMDNPVVENLKSFNKWYGETVPSYHPQTEGARNINKELPAAWNTGADYIFDADTPLDMEAGRYKAFEEDAARVFGEGGVVESPQLQQAYQWTPAYADIGAALFPFGRGGRGRPDTQQQALSTGQPRLEPPVVEPLMVDPMKQLAAPALAPKPATPPVAPTGPTAPPAAPTAAPRQATPQSIGERGTMLRDAPISKVVSQASPDAMLARDIESIGMAKESFPPSVFASDPLMADVIAAAEVSLPTSQAGRLNRQLVTELDKKATDILNTGLLLRQQQTGLTQPLTVDPATGRLMQDTVSSNTAWEQRAKGFSKGLKAQANKYRGQVEKATRNTDDIKTNQLIESVTPYYTEMDGELADLSPMARALIRKVMPQTSMQQGVIDELLASVDGDISKLGRADQEYIRILENEASQVPVDISTLTRKQVKTARKNLETARQEAKRKGDLQNASLYTDMYQALGQDVLSDLKERAPYYKDGVDLVRSQETSNRLYAHYYTTQSMIETIQGKDLERSVQEALKPTIDKAMKSRSNKAAKNMISRLRTLDIDPLKPSDQRKTPLYKDDKAVQDQVTEAVTSIFYDPKNKTINVIEKMELLRHNKELKDILWNEMPADMTSALDTFAKIASITRQRSKSSITKEELMESIEFNDSVIRNTVLLTPRFSYWLLRPVNAVTWIPRNL